MNSNLVMMWLLEAYFVAPAVSFTTTELGISVQENQPFPGCWRANSNGDCQCWDAENGGCYPLGCTCCNWPACSFGIGCCGLIWCSIHRVGCIEGGSRLLGEESNEDPFKHTVDITDAKVKKNAMERISMYGGKAEDHGGEGKGHGGEGKDQ
mmetsp:Transcript_4563/g.7687  ORF Transcript_4563/g.7687 Transcript_4563/m.7687 type:complete len:152 (+) Transcript_4563:66-521(+)